MASQYRIDPLAKLLRHVRNNSLIEYWIPPSDAPSHLTGYTLQCTSSCSVFTWLSSHSTIEFVSVGICANVNSQKNNYEKSLVDFLFKASKVESKKWGLQNLSFVYFRYSTLALRGHGPQVTPKSAAVS